MAIWLKENRVLQIVLQDSLHQPQYVEKLEKVIRFIIKEKSLTLEDLHDIWNAQVSLYGTSLARGVFLNHSQGK